MPNGERRRSRRLETNLLVSYRDKEPASTQAGYMRALNLSQGGMLVGSPDRFQIGSVFFFEILLDYNRAVVVEGQVLRFEPGAHGDNRVGIEFVNMSAETKRWLSTQLDAS